MKTAKTINAHTLIKQDHRSVEKLYREYKAAGADASTRDTLAKKICRSLDMHAKMEEKHYYPAIRKASKTDGDALIAEAYAEHLGMKVLVKTVKTLPEGRIREATLKALMDVVKHHVAEEEKEIIPHAEKVLGEDMLMELGAKMTTMSPSEKDKRATGQK